MVTLTSWQNCKSSYSYSRLTFAFSCRLENALVLAKEFDSCVKTELRILKDFEDTLRGLGPIADDLETISEQLTEHKVSEALSHHKLVLLRPIVTNVNIAIFW